MITNINKHFSECLRCQRNKRALNQSVLPRQSYSLEPKVTVFGSASTCQNLTPTVKHSSSPLRNSFWFCQASKIRRTRTLPRRVNERRKLILFTIPSHICQAIETRSLTRRHISASIGHSSPSSCNQHAIMLSL